MKNDRRKGKCCWVLANCFYKEINIQKVQKKKSLQFYACEICLEKNLWNKFTCVSALISDENVFKSDPVYSASANGKVVNTSTIVEMNK